MNALFKKALKDVTQRKMRALLTIFGIALGVLGLTALNTASNQVRDSFLYTANAASLPDIQLATTPTHAVLAALLQQQSNVKLVHAQASDTTQWAIPSGHILLNVIGVDDFEHIPFNTFQLVEGNFPARGQIVLESSDRQLKMEHVGDQITVTVRGVPQTLIVSGFVRTQGLASAVLLGSGRGYMGEGDLETFYHVPGVNQFLVRLQDARRGQQTLQQLVNVLETHQVTLIGSRVGQSSYSNASKTDTLFSIIGVISIVALLLSVFLLISTISALVTEQFPIIGSMKAMGARRSQIMFTYLTSVAIYALLGTIVGIIIGILLGYALTTYIGSLLNLETGALSLDLSTLLLSLLVGLGVPLIAAVLPIFLGTRITVRQALAGNTLASATERTSLISHSAGNLFSFLPQVMQLGLRSLFRKRTRTLLTMLGLTVSGAVFLTVLTGIGSLSASIDQLVNTYHLDAIATFSQPVSSSQLQQALIGVPGIKRSEGTTTITAKTAWGSIVVKGLSADTQIYQKNLQAGRWYSANEQNVVVINQRLADLSGLKVGDTLMLHDDLHSASWHIIGIVLDSNNVSAGAAGVVLTSIQQSNAFRHTPLDFVDGLMVQSSNSQQAAIDTLSSRLDGAFSRMNWQSSIQTSQQYVQGVRSEIQSVAALLFIAAAIVALVGAMSLFNALAMSVLERQREIGILRSMGADGRKIVQVFWMEGTALGILAWFVALLIGLPMAYAFVRLIDTLLAPMPFAFNPLNLIWMLGFIIIIATLSSIGPALGAARIKIAQTLRYE